MKLIDKAYEGHSNLNQTMGKTTIGKLTVLSISVIGAYGYLKDGYELASYVRSGVSNLSVVFSQKSPFIQDRPNHLNESQLLSFSYAPTILTTEGTSVTYSAVTATTSTAVTFSRLI